MNSLIKLWIGFLFSSFVLGSASADSMTCAVTNPISTPKKTYQVEVNFVAETLTEIQSRHFSDGSVKVKRTTLLSKDQLSSWSIHRKDCETVCFCQTNRQENSYRFSFSCWGVAGMLFYDFKKQDGVYYQEYPQGGLSYSLAFKDCRP